MDHRDLIDVNEVIAKGAKMSDTDETALTQQNSIGTPMRIVAPMLQKTCSMEHGLHVGR